MSKRYIVIPHSREKAYEGDIVTLSSMPSEKWIIKFGYYTYYNYQYTGWYLTNVPNGNILPINDDDVDKLTIISTNSSTDCDCNGRYPPPPPPGPERPKPEKDNSLRSWISVDTIADRDRLSKKPLPDGKIVRVNRTPPDSKPGYYIWNVVTQTWDDFDFAAGSTVKYLTKEEADELYAEKSIQDNLTKTVEAQIKLTVPYIVKDEIAQSEIISDLQDRVEVIEAEGIEANYWQQLEEVQES